MRRFFIALATIAVLTMAPHGPAHAQLFGPAGLDSSFCEQKTFRSTVVYVDDTVMREGQTAWAATIASKLKATLIPGERVAVVQLSPRQGSSQQIWTACWPDFSKEERARLGSESFIFSRSPLANVEKQQNFFLSELGVALGKIYEASRQGGGVGTGPKKKALVEALASDGARYSQGSGTVRAIVYSDLEEDSDIGNVSQKTPPEAVGKRLGTQFRRGVFYFFGVGINTSPNGSSLQTIRNFWGPVLASMDAAIEGFGSDLTISNVTPISAYAFNVALDRNGQKLFGKASILTDRDGNLIDSWIGVTRLTFAGLIGTLHCSNGKNCTFSASTSGGLVTNNSSESIEISGGDLSNLAGTIGVKGALTFPITFTSTQD